MPEIDPLLAREGANALWFFLSLTLFLLFAGLWYRSAATHSQAAGALAVYFLGSTLSRGWNWIGIELVRRGADAESLLVDASAPAIAFNVIGFIGAVMIVRVFFPSLFFRE